MSAGRWLLLWAALSVAFVLGWALAARLVSPRKED